MGVSLTAGVFITEKQKGLLDRNLVEGNSVYMMKSTLDLGLMSEL